MSGSSGAWQPVEKSTTTAGGLGDSERSASARDRSVTIPEATAVTAGPSVAKAGVVSETPEVGSAKSMAPKELTAPLEASQGMVRPAVLPQSPPVVSPTTAEEEDEVEEIVHAEPRT